MKCWVFSKMMITVAMVQQARCEMILKAGWREITSVHLVRIDAILDSKLMKGIYWRRRKKRKVCVSITTNPPKNPDMFYIIMACFSQPSFIKYIKRSKGNRRGVGDVDEFGRRKKRFVWVQRRPLDLFFIVRLSSFSKTRWKWWKKIQEKAIPKKEGEIHDCIDTRYTIQGLSFTWFTKPTGKKRNCQCTSVAIV